MKSNNSGKSVVIDQGDEDDLVESRNNLPAFRGISSASKTENVRNNKGAKSNSKTQEADVKRQNALAEKWKTLQNQKFTIANALKGESLNKKIKFDEDGSKQESKDSKSSKKISLFDDDDDDDNDNDGSSHQNNGELVSDFKLKLRFEGEKGKKLFHMHTSKATGDDRFVMDKRFFDEQEATEKMSDDEIEKQMNILENVVGRSITKPKKNDDEVFNMVRYDPTQEEHKKYIKDKPELPKQKRPKKQKVGLSKVKADPVVDTDKYFKVGDKLKDVFSSQNKFSLTSLFHTSDKNNYNVDQNEYRSEKISKPLKKFGKNPFIDDSSESENDESHMAYEEKTLEVRANKVPSGKVLGSRGVWREVFFFKVDDSRFKDAEEIYDPQFNKTHYNGNQDPKFIQLRDKMKEFLKNKDKRHKRNVSKKMFNRKLGGTHNNQKHHKTSQIKNEKNKPKIREKKKIKLSET